MKNSCLQLVLLILFSVSNSFSQVTFQSLLEEMTDRDALAKWPTETYKHIQASSYDRKSKSVNEGWYANGDGAGFERMETNQGRIEKVLMDHKGPGALVRFWSTYFDGKFQNGKLRFYFDGNKKPTIEADFTDIVGGKLLVDGVLSERTGDFLEAGNMLGGKNLYLPIPYAKGCKVTYEGTDKTFYYAINYRAYKKGTKVKTFSMKDLKENTALLKNTIKELEHPTEITFDEEELIWCKDAKVKPNASKDFELKGQKAIRSFSIQLQADDINQALLSTVIEMSFDGQKTVTVPVGSFFGTGYASGNTYETRYTKSTIDRVLTSTFIMPFQNKAKVSIKNLGAQEIVVSELKIKYTDWEWDKNSLYFHADYRSYVNVPSARGRDTNFINIKGRGKYVGDNLTIFNNAPRKSGQPWWGEGDEKIYVDGEKFPSIFGTGTEDYYGYAWIGCRLFSNPFLCQATASGNRGRGLTVVNRFRILDDIVFNKSLKFDMEIWHWVKCNIDYEPATFWYGDKEAKSVVSIDSNEAFEFEAKKIQRTIQKTGRLEAEEFLVDVSGTEANSLVLTAPKDRALSNRSTLYVRNVQKGDEVKISFNYSEVPNSDFGLLAVASKKSTIYDVYLNGTKISEFDLTPSQVVNVSQKQQVKKKKKGKKKKGKRNQRRATEVKELTIPQSTMKKGVNTLVLKPKTKGVSEFSLDCILKK